MTIGELHIPIARVLDHRISLDQVIDPRIQGVCGLKTGGLNLRIGDDIVPLIRVLADGRVEKHEVGNVFLDMFAELSLRNIGIGQADVVDLAFHLVELFDGMLEHARDISYMDVIPFEGTLK